jgi:hypothetical protein
MFRALLAYRQLSAQLYETTVQSFYYSQDIAMLSSLIYEYKDGHVHSNLEQPVGLARY